MDIVIRPEIEADYEEVDFLTREAFWDVYKPGCDEHLVAHKLRAVPAFIPELDLVAVLDGRIIGNIMYSEASVVSETGARHAVVTFGPLSVLPELQHKGVGSALVKQTIKLAAEMGYGAILIFGNPGYYHKFGFVSAETYGISTSDGENFDAFMALELYEGALQGVSGRFFEDPVFHTEPEELEEFEKKFPFREKHVTDTQL